jgi:hypothetical protein
MENFEKVEAYFENRLGENEKQDFLKEVESNPELKSEFEFQRQVIEGIKEVRKAELKTMLDNVPIASVGTSTSVLNGFKKKQTTDNLYFCNCHL